MTDSRPLICTSLHLPPDPQPFLRIHEISLEIFLQNLDQLRLALEATQKNNPEATQVFRETRKVLSEELLKVFKVLQYGQDVAERYYRVLEALEEKKPTQTFLYEVGLGAEMGTMCSKEALQAMSVFRRELEKAVDRVTTTTGAHEKKSPKISLASSKNIQSVSEIFSAINECNGLLQQCYDQFARLVTQTQNENSIDSDPPSEEEIQVMRAKWQTYFDAVKGVWMEGFKITDEIILPTSNVRWYPSESRKPRQKAPLWRTLFQRRNKRDLAHSTNVSEVFEESSDPSIDPVTSPSGTSPVPADATEALEPSGSTADSNTASSNFIHPSSYMASRQPLIFTSLHMPPDLQPFQRIHDISLEIFLPNLDHLRLALEATRDINPEAVQIFHETRKVLREELLTAFKPLQLGQEVAERYSEVLKALQEKKPTQDHLYRVCLRAQMGMKVSKEALQAMSVFRRELEKAVDRMTTTTGATKKGAKSPLTTAKNIQSVSEILSAINECNGLLQQCHDQFAQLVTQTRNETSIDSNPPSEEETQLMRTKWKTYFETVGGFWIHGFKITDEIQFPSKIRRRASGRPQPRQKVPLWRALFQRRSKQDLVRSTHGREVPEGLPAPRATMLTPSRSHEIRASVINEVDSPEGFGTSENAEVPSATPPNHPKSSHPKAPFWQNVFRRTYHHNRMRLRDPKQVMVQLTPSFLRPRSRSGEGSRAV